MPWKLVLPWRYLILLAIGLAVLWALMAVYGRNVVVLGGWLAGWLIVSRTVDFFYWRGRKRRQREEDAAEDEKKPPESDLRGRGRQGEGASDE